MPQRGRTLAAAGFTLLPVVLAMSLIGAIAFMLNRDNGLTSNLIGSQSDLARARYAAAAGLQAVNYTIQALGCAGSFPISSSPVMNGNFGAAAYSAYANNTTGSPLTLTSTGTYNGASVTLTKTNAYVYQPPSPMLGNAFSPASINAGGGSTLTVILSNPNALVATLTAPLIDTLPSGVVIAATPTVGTTCGGVAAPVAVAGGSTVTLPAGRSIPANDSCTLTVNVTAAVGGSYINTLLAGALVTSNGNNAARADVSLTVIPPGPTPPMLGKAFSPASINAGGGSTLTVTLSNPNGFVATLTAPLIDTLPSEVVIAATPTVGTTCGGVGAPVAVAGGSTVTLPAGRSIPANGSCTLTVNVTAAVGGTPFNTLLAGALATSMGNNAASAVATLTVIPPPGISGIFKWVTQPGPATGKDTSVRSNNSSKNYGGSTQLPLDRSSESDILLQFDLSPLPAGSRVVPRGLQPGAIVSLYQQSVGISQQDFLVRLITRSWVAGTQIGSGTANGATWTTYDGVNNWPSPGVGYGPRELKLVPEDTGGWLDMDITAAVLAWMSGMVPNYGVWLDPNNQARNYDFNSSDFMGDASLRPKLTAYYLLPCGASAPP